MNERRANVQGRDVLTMSGTVALKIGDLVPDFSLPDTEGAMHTLGDVSTPATVVLVTCNHCPYALAWHDRLTAVARDYSDSPEAMRRRVRDEFWPMPYLHDATQEVLRSYGASVTPELFVLDADRRLRYHGAPDGSHDDHSHNARWLRDALDAVLAGHEVRTPETRPVGCSVKWKPSG